MSIVLHPVPRLSAVAKEQIRAAGSTSRSYLVGLLGVSALLEAGAIGFAIRNTHLVQHGESPPSLSMGFAPEISIITAAVGVFLPFVVWVDEDPTRRAYHWIMPANRTMHSISKVIGGWCWLMLATLLFLLAVAGGNVLMLSIQHLHSAQYEGIAWWHYLVPFMTATVFYIFGSAAVVGAQKPIVWLFGVPFLYEGAREIMGTLGFAGAAKSLGKLWTGPYGAHFVVGQDIRYWRVGMNANGALIDPSAAPAMHWMLATVIWCSVALLLLLYTSQLRREVR